jgi:hypothetical protein
MNGGAHLLPAHVFAGRQLTEQPKICLNFEEADYGALSTAGSHLSCVAPTVTLCRHDDSCLTADRCLLPRLCAGWSCGSQSGGSCEQRCHGGCCCGEWRRGGGGGGRGGGGGVGPRAWRLLCTVLLSYYDRLPGVRQSAPRCSSRLVFAVLGPSHDRSTGCREQVKSGDKRGNFGPRSNDESLNALRDIDDYEVYFSFGLSSRTAMDKDAYTEVRRVFPSSPQ